MHEPFPSLHSSDRGSVGALQVCRGQTAEWPPCPTQTARSAVWSNIYLPSFIPTLQLSSRVPPPSWSFSPRAQMDMEVIAEERILRIFTGEEIEELAFMGLTEELEEHLGIALADSFLSQFEPHRGMGSIMVRTARRNRRRQC